MSQPLLTAPGAPAATLPVVRALLDEARAKGYTSGVLGVRARPSWDGPDELVHEQTPVRIVSCGSTLAVREALLERAKGRWLVLLTDREDSDLGAGVLSRLVFHRLRTPDPWEAVRRQFAATGLDPALTTAGNHRELAGGLLAATPTTGWPAAAGGVLTRDHALASAAQAHLGISSADLFASGVLAWTLRPDATARIADLRQLAGDALTDALMVWLAQRCGAPSTVIGKLLQAGETSDVVPLGLLVGLVDAALRSGNGNQVQTAQMALVRLEGRLGATPPPAHVLRAWGVEACSVLDAALRDPALQHSVELALARGDALLAQAQATSLTELSDTLPSGLTGRLLSLAEALRNAVLHPSVPEAAVQAVERAWSAVGEHRLAATDPRLPVFRAAVRLVRWLTVPDATDALAVTDLVARHTDADAWVDSAVNDAARGVDEQAFGAALESVLERVRERRDRHDRDFAHALVQHTASGAASTPELLHLESLVADVVVPIARTAPVLLLVLDGMSVGVGHEVLGDVLGRPGGGWTELLLPGRRHRAAALAVLPTLTEVSRASLLCGELRTGQQSVEQRGHKALTEAHGLRAVLFHKKPLDSSRLGHALADDVGAAVDDVDGTPLVTCVLNTIDDALDRSDPSGTEWGADAVRHLEPLLTRARLAGRVVVLTADHGHVVERRKGRMQSGMTISSGRSRSAEPPVGDGEVLVEGRRVLTDDHRAVLAVDERLRYGPMKAGYHGGASPAEVVVPVTLIVSGPAPEGYFLAPAQEPSWWSGPTQDLPPVVLTPKVSEFARKAARETPTLFDDPVEAPARPSVVDDVLASPTYAEQRTAAGRSAVTDAQVTALLTALLLSPGTRLPAARASVALSVAPVQLRGAVGHVQRLLNIEGYGVLTVDADGSTLVLDVDLLHEQFEVRR